MQKKIILLFVLAICFSWHMAFFNKKELLNEYGEPIPIELIDHKKIRKLLSSDITIDGNVFRTKDKLYIRIKSRNLLKNINTIDKIFVNKINKEVCTIYSNRYFSLYCVDISEFNTTEKINFIIYNNGLYYKNNI